MKRWADKWLTFASTLGPLIFGISGFAMGQAFKVGALYQSYKTDHDTLEQVIVWKMAQEEFDRKTIDAIARLQEITKRIR